MRRLLLAPAVILLTLAASTASAAPSFFTLTDDGTIEAFKFQTANSYAPVEKKLLALYRATGAELPDIFSVWTTFPLDGDTSATYFDPFTFDTRGLGLEQYFGNSEIASPYPPVRSMLFHNDLLVLDQRATEIGAPTKDFGRYLFLLEMTHNWGPEIELPSPNQQELVGFPFHWSFWMDAGGSPAGGNHWKDNGDGTFDAVPLDASTVTYSMVDLYLMGLATAAEVPPFGVLEHVTPPASITDPAWGGAYAAHSFPWMTTTETFTAKATRRTVTIDDVITANGARMPAAGSGPTTYKLAIVLITSKQDAASEVESAQALFAPIASGFGPAFHEATMGRATLDVITPPPSTSGAGGAGGAGSASASTTVAASGAGGANTSASAAATSGGEAETNPGSSGCGCALETRTSPWGALAIGAAIAALASRRRRA